MEHSTARNSSIRSLRVGDVRVPRYQRPEKTTFIRRMLRKFDEDLLGTIVVSERDDGSLWVIDGQQRISMCIVKFGPDYMIRAEVFTGLSEQQEANKFAALDLDRTGLSPYDHFMGRLAMGGIIEKDIVSILERHGTAFGAGSGAGSSNKTKAAAILYDLHKHDILDRALTVSVGAYGADGGSVHSTILNGFLTLYHHYPEIDDARLTRVLAAHGSAQRLIGSSRGVVSTRGGSTAIANTMIQIYNHRLSSSRRLNPIVSKYT